MAFPPADLRRTVRRGRDGAPAQLFPRLLLGSAPLPRLSVAIRYFESMLGRRRGDLQPSVLVEFFADARLARCIVACLARSYTYRQRTASEIAGADAAARLAAEGLAAPRDLRLWLYALANRECGGWLAPAERATRLQPHLDRWGLSLAQFDSLLIADREEERVLERSAAEAPRPEDLAALYNYQTVETALRLASRVVLTAATVDRAVLKLFGALTRRYGVAGRIERSRGGPGRARQTAEVRFVLSGRQDALGSWVRHGSRLARIVARLVATGAVDAGTATVEIAGATHTMRLDGALLDIIGAPLGAGGENAEPVRPLTDTFEVDLRREMSALRRQGVARGWTVRADPDPVVLEGGIFLPDLALAGKGRRVLLAVATAPAVARNLGEVLPLVAGKAPVVAVVAAGLVDLVKGKGVPVVSFDDQPPAFELVALAESGAPFVEIEVGDPVAPTARPDRAVA